MILWLIIFLLILACGAYVADRGEQVPDAILIVDVLVSICLVARALYMAIGYFIGIYSMGEIFPGLALSLGLGVYFTAWGLWPIVCVGKELTSYVAKVLLYGYRKNARKMHSARRAGSGCPYLSQAGPSAGADREHCRVDRRTGSDEFVYRDDMVFMMVALTLMASLAAGEMVSQSQANGCIAIHTTAKRDRPLELHDHEDQCRLRCGPCVTCVDLYRQCKYFKAAR